MRDVLWERAFCMRCQALRCLMYNLQCFARASAIATYLLVSHGRLSRLMHSQTAASCAAACRQVADLPAARARGLASRSHAAAGTRQRCCQPNMWRLPACPVVHDSSAVAQIGELVSRRRIAVQTSYCFAAAST